MNKFKLKTEIYFGENSLAKLEVLKNKKVMIVCDGFMVKSGMVDKIKSRISTCKIDIFSEVLPDPSIKLVSAGVAQLGAFAPDVVIGFGGGSSIDAAKAMCEIASNMDKYDVYIEQFIAIPTTSGTGSEVTQYSVITDTEAEVKYPLTSESLIPDIAILDPDLVVSVPKRITANTGMDVLTHSIEAFVSTGATDFTDALAEKSIKLIAEFLPQAYDNGSDPLARERVHNASCLAGMAFDTAGLGIVHSLAHAIGGKYHLPHGFCNAVILPHVIRFNASRSERAASRYAYIAKMIGFDFNSVKDGVECLVNFVFDLQRHFEIPNSYKEVIMMTVTREDRRDLADKALHDVCTSGNPAKVSEDDFLQLLDILV